MRRVGALTVLVSCAAGFGLGGGSGCGRIAFDPTAEPTTTLVAGWRFDEGSGERAVDHSGRGNDLLLRGGIAWGPRAASMLQTGEFAFPTGSPEGLGWDGISLWLSGRNPNTIYRLDYGVALTQGTCGTNGCIVGSFASPAGFPEGLTWDGTSFWHCDGNNEVFAIDPRAGLTAGTCTSGNGCITAAFSAPATGLYCESVAWDGERLWLSHSATDRIYALDAAVGAAMGTCSTANGCVLGSFTTPGMYPEGIEWNGRELWHTDANTVMLYQLDATVGLAMGSCTAANGCVTRQTSLPGTFSEDIAWEGATRLWTLDLGTKRVYQFSYAPASRCKRGGCIELDRHARHDAVVMDAASIATIARGLTIELWLFPREVRDQTVFTYGLDRAAAEGLAVRLDSTGALQFELGNGDAVHAVTASSYRRDEWMHVAATWDGRTMTCYVNGEQACAPQAFAGPVLFDANVGRLGSDGAQDFFVGTVDEVNIYAGALSAAEIRATYDDMSGQ